MFDLLAIALPSADQLFEIAVAWSQDLSLITVWAACFGVLLLCGFGLPVPEDITLVFCGYMTWMLTAPPDGGTGDFGSAATAVLIGMTGVLLGDMAMFTLGQKFGSRLIHKWPFRSFMAGGRGDKARGFLASNGPKVLFSARFMPGLRSVVFFTSGTLGIRLRTFLLYDGLAALLSVPALVLSAWYWGPEIQQVINWARSAGLGAAAVIGLLVVLLLFKMWRRARRQRRERDEASVLASAVNPPEPEARTGGIRS